MTTPTYATGKGATAPTFGGYTTAAGLPDKKLSRSVEFEYDLSTFTGTTGQSVALMTLPAFTQVDGIQVIVQTAVASGNTISVGDSSSTTLYVSGATPTTVGTVLTQAITTNPLKFYGATADTLNVTVTNSTLPTTGVLRFIVKLTDMSRNAIMTVQ